MKVAAFLLAAVAVLVTGAPARAAAATLKLTPSTVQAGYLVGIEATCTDNSKAVTVKSDVFGEVQVQPQGTKLTAAVTVPKAAEPGEYDVTLTCADDTATAELNVLAAVEPSRGPATGFGGMAGGGTGTLLLTVGLAALAAAAALGLVAVRRRRA